MAATAPTSYREKLAEGDLPDDVRAAIEREVDKLERTSEQSPEHGWIRTWLDTILELPWGVRSEERLDVIEARDDPRRRPHRARRREGPHRRVPGGAQAARRARHDRRSRRMLADPTRAVDAARARSSRSSVLPASARRRSVSRSRARSGGSSCASPSVVCATRPRSAATGAPTWAARPGRIVRALTEAGTMNPVILLDEVDKLGRRLARRPVVGAARGARPGAEPHVPRPLPRRRPRPVGRAVPRDGQRARDHPRAAARPPRGDPPRRLHRGREGRDRPRPPAGPPARAQRAHRRRRDRLRRRAAAHRRRLHARSGRAEPRARARQAAAQDRGADRVGDGDASRVHRRGRRRARARAGQVLRGSCRAHLGAGRGHRASRSPAPVATCSSSRPRPWTASPASRSPVSSAT